MEHAHIGAPRLVRVLHGVGFDQSGLECFRRRCLVGGKGELEREHIETFAQHAQGIAAQNAECAGGGFGGDKGVAIAVTADPGTEVQQWFFMPFQRRGIRPRIAPGMTEIGVEILLCFGQYLGQVIKQIGQLVIDCRLLAEQLAGQPQAFKQGIQRLGGILKLEISCAVLAVLEQFDDVAVDAQHGPALGLGRVFGEAGSTSTVASLARTASDSMPSCLMRSK